MAARSVPLAQIRVAEPCPMDWKTMTGDDQKRFCSFCNLHVHNLSAMTEDAAQRLICQTAGRLCVAYFPNPDGSPQTLEYRPKPAKRGWTWKAASFVGFIGAMAAGVINHAFGRQTIPAPPVQGMIPMVAGGIGPPPPQIKGKPMLADGQVAPPQPQLMGEMVMGDIAPPSTQPATQPTTNPALAPE